MSNLHCETCAHWAPLDRLTAYAAVCAIGSYPGRVAFDQGCDKHSSTPAPQAQSEVRGLPAIVQMYAPKGTP